MAFPTKTIVNETYEGQDVQCCCIVAVEPADLKFPRLCPANDSYVFQMVAYATENLTVSITIGDTTKTCKLSNEFARYIIKFPVVDVSSSSDLYMHFPVGTYFLYNVQLERATTASAWRPAPEDQEEYADKAAKYAVEAQTQRQIFNKLTNNGEVEGLFMKDGQLYINATYLTTGILNANLLQAGVIRSADGRTYWDLENNVFVIASISSIAGSGIASEEQTDALTTDINEIFQHFIIGNDASLTISTDNGMSITLSQGTVTITDTEHHETIITGTQVAANYLVATESMLIGNHKFLARSNGTNTTLVYVGD